MRESWELKTHVHSADAHHRHLGLDGKQEAEVLSVLCGRVSYAGGEGLPPAKGEVQRFSRWTGWTAVQQAKLWCRLGLQGLLRGRAVAAGLLRCYGGG